MCVLWQVFYVVDKPSKDWKGGKGYMNKDVLLKVLPAPSDDALILVYLVCDLSSAFMIRTCVLIVFSLPFFSC